MKFLKLILATVAAMCFTQGFAQKSNEEKGTAPDSVTLYKGVPIMENTEEPRRYLIRKVNVHGVETIDPNVLRSSIGLIEGDSIFLPSNSINSAIQSLWNQRLYADVQVGATIDGEDVDIDIMLKERPRVFSWNFEGITKSRQNDLRDDILKLRRNTELSDYVIDKNIKLIQSYFADKGFLNAEVDIRIDNDPVRESMVNVTFVIDQKERVKIGEVVFEGNEVFEDKRLRRTFKKTNQKSWNFFKSFKFKEDEFENDKGYLIDFYNSQGYRNATVISDTIYDINEKRIGVRLKVSEGNKYYIRNVAWIGNSIYPTDQLSLMFGVNNGDTYDRKSMEKRLGIGNEANPDEMSISTLYQNEGYLTSMIEPAETIVGRDSIDLEIKIYEGRPYTINDITITGNITIEDEVVRREIYTHPGELYNRSLLMRTIQLLNAMGQFNPENLVPDIRPVSNSEVNIGFALEEQSSNQINIAAGWGSGSFVGSAGITLNNISTDNFFKKESWRPYPMGKNQSLSISGQTNGTYYKSASVSFTDPWFGGRKPNSLQLSLYYSDQNDAYYAYQTPTAYFRTLGVAAGLGKRLTWPDPYFQIYAGLNYERYSLLDWGSYFIMNTGVSNMVSAKVSLARNSVDQQIYPRRGSNFSVTAELTPPYSLFDGKDYSNEDLSDQDRYRWIEYHRWTMNADWYQTLSRNDNLVLMLSADMGYLGYYNEDKVSPFQRFEVGGDGMSGYSVYGIDVIGLRGYEDGALDPTSSYSLGYNKYTAEIRYPVVLQPSSQIYVLGFLEAGNGFSSWKSFSPFNIKRSAGVGVRLNLQVVGMLGIDWGYGFDPAAGETSKSGSQFHFVLGQQF